MGFAFNTRTMVVLKTALILSTGILSFLICQASLILWSAHKKWVLEYWAQKKCEKRVMKHLPSLCLQLSSFLHAGHALPQALKHLATSSSGKIFYSLLTSPTKNLDSDILKFLSYALTLSSKNGISLSPLLKRLSELTRFEQEFEEKIRVLSYPTKAQAAIAIALPWLVLILFYLLSPEMMSFAFHSRVGAVGFSTALLLECLALFWMKRILQ